MQVKENNQLKWKSDCCHEECAGGCRGAGAGGGGGGAGGDKESHQCDVCKHVFHDNDCKPNCPSGYYLVGGRRDDVTSC